MTDAHHKQLALRVKSSGAPDEAQLAAIRQFTLADMPAEKLYVRTFVLAHNAIDRDNECFGEAILTDFARTLPGKGLFIKHPTSWQGDGGPGEGRFFDAQLVRMPFDQARKELQQPNLQFPPDAADAVLLMASAYLVKTSDNGALLDKIDGGVAGDVSIGFTAKGGPERLIDAAGRELNSYRWNGPGEALEGSLVWLGAQPGARAVKAAPTSAPETSMDLQKLFDDATAKNLKLTADLEVASKAAADLTAIKAALGDDAVLLDTPAALVDVISAGKAYKTALINDVVKAERLLGLCGDDDASIKAATDAHAAQPITRIAALAKHYEARVPTGSKLAGGDPNHNPGPPAKLPAALDTPAL